MTDLEFGVFDWLDVNNKRSIAETYDDRMAIARRADAGAFARIHYAEHHAATLGLAASPGLFAAAVARETERIKLAPMTFIVPLYDPLRLVQEIAMIDQLSHGRLELGIGKGSSPIEAKMFGFTAEEVQARYDTFVPAILEALDTGVFVSPVTGEQIDLIIRPSGPFTYWYPTSNPESIAKAAQNGQNTIFGFAFKSPPVEVIRERRDIYFEARAALGETGERHPRFGILRHVVVAETDAAAFDIAERAFVDHYDNFTWLWKKYGTPQADMPDLRQLVADGLFVVGSVESVTEQVTSLVNATGVNYFAAAFSWGSLDVADALTSVDLFDTNVIPAVLSAVD